MRITLVTESFYPSTSAPVAGGTTTTIKATIDRLVDIGHEVQLIAPGPGMSTYRGCDVIRVRPLEPTGAQVRAALEGFGPNVVQVHSPRLVGRKAIKHAQRLGLHTVLIEQSAVTDVVLEPWRKAVSRADRVVVTSPWMVDRAATLGVEADLWLPGVNTSTFSPTLRDAWLHGSWAHSKSGQPKVVVGYVGTLDKRNGVRRLADLAGIPGCRVVVIGDGPERAWLTRRLPKARFTGALQTGDLATALASLDVLVHPGDLETDAHALREAAASGVPVVAARAGGARDVVRHLETGVLFDPAEPRDFPSAVRAVMADRQRCLMGQAARELAVTRTWTDAVDELVASYDHSLTNA